MYFAPASRGITSTFSVANFSMSATVSAAEIESLPSPAMSAKASAGMKRRYRRSGVQRDRRRHLRTFAESGMKVARSRTVSPRSLHDSSSTAAESNRVRGVANSNGRSRSGFTSAEAAKSIMRNADGAVERHTRPSASARALALSSRRRSRSCSRVSTRRHGSSNGSVTSRSTFRVS